MLTSFLCRFFMSWGRPPPGEVVWLAYLEVEDAMPPELLARVARAITKNDADDKAAKAAKKAEKDPEPGPEA